MRRSIQLVLIAIVVGLLAAIAVSYGKYREAAANFVTLKTESDNTREHYEAAISEIAAIQDSLNTIVIKGSPNSLTPSDLDVEHKLTETGGDRALAQIAVMKAGIERTKARIQQLEVQLHRNGIKMAGLQKMIANLEQSVGDKEQQVAQLTEQVNTLQTQVSGLSTEVETQAATIEDKRRELGTIYYIAASKKDLTDKKLIEAKGGVLGLGKTLKPTGQVDESAFTAIDTDREDTIHIPGVKAHVLSAQPVASYELVPGQGETVLRILDAKEFRTVKHVVIMTG